MRIKTEPYIDLLQQLRMLAVNSKNIKQRKRMRDNMLRLAVRISDATSAYICKHDFEQKQSDIVHHFLGRQDIGLEGEGNLGKPFPESELGSLVPWLYQEKPEMYLLHPADLDPDSVEYAEYAPYNIHSVLYFPVFRKGKVWGYLELWQSRHQRKYTEIQLEKLTQVVDAISESLLTAEG